MQKMHANEITIDEALVKSLLQAQFPQWSHLPLKRIKSDGTDNAIFTLGADLCVRLPRIPKVVPCIESEQKWLPKFAPLLPLDIPRVVAQGKPQENYPCDWSIYNWITGENAIVNPICDLNQAAIDLAKFIKALQQIDTTDGPPSNRGVSLHKIDHEVRAAIDALHEVVDVKKVTQLWDESLGAKVWENKPVWLHSDLLPANLLTREGKLCAVIDFGMMGIGDPACDLLPAWSIFTKDSRKRFRDEMGVDEDTWLRGRGWALSIGLIILPYYRHTNPGLVMVGKHLISEVLV